MSSLILRSAVSTAAAAVARRSRMASSHNHNASSSLSTISFHPPPSSNDVPCDAARDDASRIAPLSVMPAVNTSYKNMSSYLSNVIAHLISGDPTLVTMDDIARRLEEDEKEREEIMSATTTTIESADDLLEQLSLWQISTLKRRKKMMNKHKLRKRRKRLRLKTRK